ncbi:hypothetical protein SASPL_131080 [Salvia splendens]|uniref:Leucine-rich repeat-containing N-terminal plant-type domain-containing protein n=1 Tax=Salvia splendens TaxID=180675 RepID=A0A8X8ZK02_SALSN|nr:hypothetical protein SASPL_131080 [Salvia splendens]
MGKKFTNGLCLKKGQNLLLQLKNELIFNSSLSSKLSQWNQTDDCCKWQGVGCDVSGNVVTLQLNNESISGGVNDSSSLFKLEHLHKLNLAYNDFIRAPIPKGILNLTNLTHLNLSYSDFGSIVEKIGYSSYMPNIIRLSLCRCSLFGPLFKSFWQLRFLSVLRLDLNDLSRAVPDMFASFLSLNTLSLVGCGLEGFFPEVIFGIPSLENLDLCHNKLLCGSIPTFNKTGSIKSMRLSFTNFSGIIPSSISNLRSLSEIDLSDCLLTGSLPSSFASLTELTYVDLSYNFFTGSLSSTLFRGFSNLVYLNLGFNSFFGGIPPSVFRLPSLLELRLSNNRFTGLVEEFPVVNLSNVVTIDLSSNRLEGRIPDSFFQLQSLEYLDLSKNLFTDVRSHNSSSYGLSKLKEMHLASCELHDFPEFIKYSDVLEYLDTWLDLETRTPVLEPFCNNTLHGEIPRSLESCESLQFLNIGNNIMNGSFPCMQPLSLRVLVLHSNRFHGEVTCHASWPVLQIVGISWNIFDGSLESINFSSWRAMVVGSEPQPKTSLPLISLEITSKERFQMQLVILSRIVISTSPTVLSVEASRSHLGSSGSLNHSTSLKSN